MSWIEFLIVGLALNTGIQPVAEVNSEHQGLALDESSHLYTYNNNTIYKFDSEWQRTNEYTVEGEGSISTMDVVSELRLNLFFAETQRIEVLGSRLSHLASLELENFVSGRVDVFTSGPNETYWAFSIEEQRLLQISNSGSVIQTISDVDLAVGELINAVDIVAGKSHVILIDEKNGMYILDLFGNYTTRLVSNPTSNVTTLDGVVLWMEESVLVRYTLENRVRTEFPMSKSAKYLGISPEFLVTGDGEVIRIFSY